MSNGYRRLYRNKQRGKLNGLCAGLGDYFHVDPVWIRLGLIVIGLFSGLGPIILIVYFAAALIVPKRPIYLYEEVIRSTFGDDEETIRPTRRNDK